MIRCLCSLEKRVNSMKVKDVNMDKSLTNENLTPCARGNKKNLSEYILLIISERTSCQSTKVASLHKH